MLFGTEHSDDVPTQEGVIYRDEVKYSSSEQGASVVCSESTDDESEDGDNEETDFEQLMEVLSPRSASLLARFLDVSSELGANCARSECADDDEFENCETDFEPLVRFARRPIWASGKTYYSSSR